MQSEDNQNNQLSEASQQINQIKINHNDLACQYNLLYRKLLYAFPDREIFNLKNFTPFSYWFTLDALYFVQNVDYDKQKLKSFRQNLTKHKEGGSNSSNIFSHEEDNKFILKARKLISQQKCGTLNLQDIQSTKTEQVIQILQKYASSLQRQNNSQLEKIYQKLKEYNQSENDIYYKLDIPILKTQNLFKYLQFQSQLIDIWIKQEKKRQTKLKCIICWKPGKLVKCTNCNLIVHAYCYPILAADKTKLYNPNLQTFVCQPCQINEKTQNQLQNDNYIDNSQRQCALCPCIGGHFMKTSTPLQRFEIKNNEQDTNDMILKIFKIPFDKEKDSKNTQYIHLTCFIWNPQCIYNNFTKLVDGINNIPQKKFSSICDICGVSIGSSVSCAGQGCRKTFHPECARRKKLDMVYIKAATQLFIEIYCPRHHPQKGYQLLKKSHLNNFKDIRKFFESADREIKRIQNQSNFMQKKILFEYDLCTICRNPQNGQSKTLCKSCRKWYHLKCGSQCPNCT